VTEKRNWGKQENDIEGESGGQKSRYDKTQGEKNFKQPESF